MSDHFTDFALPDTDLTRRSYEFVRQISSTALLNHSVRTFLFGRAAGEAAGLKPGADYDEEVLFLASVLHDAGLTERGDGDQRFEVDGADLARAFVTEQGLADDRAQLVWEAIALHTSVGIASRMRPEIALTHAGAGMDVIGLGVETLPADLTDRAHAAFPRLDGGTCLTDTIVGQAVRNPAKAPLGSFPAEIVRQERPDAPVLAWRDLIATAWQGVA
ncbi:HD domain-containing protein [Actinomadura hibisca]|uniref:HD domain-containing protein n=1 Tax=Actinomadura hibisca TaxID=68565 RepID=UPI0008328052|nr:HD domain-containing protein [Actinomadura hibisca]